MTNKYYQRSESLTLGIILAIAGGYWDAYTYLMRGNVFANAETGNIVLLGINIAKGDYYHAMCCFFPIASFAMGVVITELIRKKFKFISLFHWRNIIITMEISLIFLVGILPQSFESFANVIVAFVCAMQVATFKRVRDCPCATTMCTGNLRSGTENLLKAISNNDKEYLGKSAIYFTVILFFVVGAVVGAAFCKIFEYRAVWISCIFLFLAYFIMMEKEIENIEEINKDITLK